jgi:hypothetical protein
MDPFASSVSPADGASTFFLALVLSLPLTLLVIVAFLQKTRGDE